MEMFASHESRREILAWMLYDFANTIFSMNVVTMYFALWLIKDKGGQNITYSLVLSASMLAVALAVPMLGAMSDKSRRRKPFLFLFTILCIIATALIGIFDNLHAGVLFFFVANFSYQASLVFYDSLLPAISRPENIGKNSGYGVALGYLGSFFGMGMVLPFVNGDIAEKLLDKVPFLEILYVQSPTSGDMRVNAFLPTALLFLLFSLPLFFFVRDRVMGKDKFSFDLGFAYKRLFETARNVKRYPGLSRFLFGRFLYVDAINTVIAFMSIFTAEALGFSSREITIFFMINILFAVLGSFVCGFSVDRFGPKKTLFVVISAWILADFLTIIADKNLIWVVGFLAGCAMGSTWTTDRAYLVDLSPPQRLGEFFGLYGLSGKFASVIGPLVWGIVIYLAEPSGALKYRFAVASLLLFFIAGLLVIRRVPDTRGKDYARPSD